MNDTVQQPPSSQVPDRLRYFPVSFFAVVMGCMGLTLAWQKASVVLQFSPLPSQLLLGLSVIALIAISSIYLLKIIKHRDVVIKEFHHPVKLSFFPAFSIALILSSVATIELAPSLSELLLLVGAALQLAFTLSVLVRWIHHDHFQVNHSTPAWFIPVVGNILVPISGVEHGYMELSWFFFSLGLLFWLILKTMVFNRLTFHDPLPEKLLPTLFIFIAPPAVGFISYLKLQGGELDSFGRILFYIASFLVLLMLVQLPRFTKLSFYMSWWAYSFPLAAFTISVFWMYQLTGLGFFHYLGIVMLFVVTSIVLLLLYKTVCAVRKGAVFEVD